MVLRSASHKVASPVRLDGLCAWANRKGQGRQPSPTSPALALFSPAPAEVPPKPFCINSRTSTAASSYSRARCSRSSPRVLPLLVHSRSAQPLPVRKQNGTGTP